MYSLAYVTNVTYNYEKVTLKLYRSKAGIPNLGYLYP